MASRPFAAPSSCSRSPSPSGRRRSMKMDTPGSKVRNWRGPVLAWGAMAVALAAGAPGCAILARQQTDQPVQADKVAKVEKGMTKGQVTDLLGAPQEIVFSNKEHDPLREHAYIYEYKVQLGTAIFFGVVNFGNLDQKRDRVIVFFG